VECALIIITLAPFPMRFYVGLFKVLGVCMTRSNGHHFAGFSEVHHVVSPREQVYDRVQRLARALMGDRLSW
jgi:hypothetical protein